MIRTSACMSREHLRAGACMRMHACISWESSGMLPRAGQAQTEHHHRIPTAPIPGRCTRCKQNRQALTEAHFRCLIYRLRDPPAAETRRATALQTQRPERAASAVPGAGTAPRRGRHFRQGHQLEQAAQGGPVDHLGALATAPRRGPAVRCRGIAPWKGRASHSCLRGWEPAWRSPREVVEAAMVLDVCIEGGRSARPPPLTLQRRP